MAADCMAVADSGSACCTLRGSVSNQKPSQGDDLYRETDKCSSIEAAASETPNAPEAEARHPNG